MKIWNIQPTVDQLNSANRDTIHEALGIQFINVGEDFLEAAMPVDRRTKQLAGLLHGGASVVLAESLGSIASFLVVGSREKIYVGIEVNASHLSSALEGSVVGKVTPIRLGKLLHVWNIEIRASREPHSKPICHARLTVCIKDKH